MDVSQTCIAKFTSNLKKKKKILLMVPNKESKTLSALLKGITSKK